MSSKGKKSRRTEQERKSQNRRLIAFTVVLGIAIVAGVLGSLLYQGGFFVNNAAAITIDGTKYKLCEFNFYYYAYYNAYIDENEQYMDYMFDESKSLKDQAYDDTESWHDFFVAGAKDSMISVVCAAKEAQEKNFSLSDKANQQIDETMKSIQSSAELANISEDAYLSNIYGKGMTEKLYKRHQEYTQLAAEYGDALKAGYTFSAKEIEDYYKDHEEQYTFVNYERFYVKASEVDTEPSKEEKAAAQETAQKIYDLVAEGQSLEEACSGYSDYGTYYTFDDAYYDPGFSYGEWLFSPERKDGDFDLIDDGSGYYVMVFHSRNAGDYRTANIEDLCFAVDVSSLDTNDANYDKTKNQLYEDSCTQAENVLKEWSATDKSQASFKQLAKQYEDESDKDGSFENLLRNVLDAEIDQWVFSEERKAGDAKVLYTENGFHVIYYAGKGVEAWQIESEEDLRNETYNKWYQKLIDSAKTTVSKYVLGFAGGENE